MTRLSAGFLLIALVAPGLISVAHSGLAACPAPCTAGGGPAAPDCFIQFSGITTTAIRCTDGDASCDTDGLVDGVCTIALSVCANADSSGCAATPLAGAPTVKPTKSTAAAALNAALSALPLTTPACTTPPYAANLKVSVAGLKPGVEKLTFKAKGGTKTDKDKLTITCNPAAAPSFANVVQPIFTAKCATPTCHQGLAPSGNLNMETGNSYAALVNHAPDSGLAKGLDIVEPSSIKKSYMARKILAQGLAAFDSPMPQGCPTATPCLTDAEKIQILSWIQAGAPNN